MMTSNKLLLLLTLFLCYTGVEAQEKPITKTSFDNINLDAKGLEKTKKFVASADYANGAKELLKYYRNRSNDAEKSTSKKVDNKTLELANDILLHKFKPHKAYPTYDYGKDINWQYRPVKDQLLTTFLHRTAFWEPLGIVYKSTGDEKYAKEWVFEVRDWIKKNKLGAYPDDKEYAWKAFVVSFRLYHWASFFNQFVNSPNFTPEFLMEFLNAYNEQANYVIANYTDIGNHRLYEAEHLLDAGTAFPELKNASEWRKSGIEVLNGEIGKQVMSDGMQFELSPSYHIGTIGTFLRALKTAQSAGMEKEFPESYSKLLEQMVLAVPKFSFPDYTFPLYGNSFMTNKRTMLANYKNWAEVFPQNKEIEYFATDAVSGKRPEYLSSSLPNSGFYAFRNGWDKNATVMQIKAGPSAEFHSHPDNGNFVLWVKGRDFTPDAGSFIYANVGNQVNEKRDWYRSTKAHQTLTIDDKTIENNAKLLEWQPDGNVQVLSYTNPSYKDLSHQRTFLFIDKTFFVVIDKAIGDAKGNLGIHYNLKEDSKAIMNLASNSINTNYADGNNLLIQVLNKDKVTMKKVPSFVSYEYQKETARPAFVFEKPKIDSKSQSFISILYPYNGQTAPVITTTENKENNLAEGIIDLTITINGKSTRIQKNL